MFAYLLRQVCEIRRVDKEIYGTKCQETDPLYFGSGLVTLFTFLSRTRSEQ